MDPGPVRLAVEVQTIQGGAGPTSHAQPAGAGTLIVPDPPPGPSETVSGSTSNTQPVEDPNAAAANGVEAGNRRAT